MRWIARQEYVPLPDGGEQLTDYRYCLDALIRTICEMKLMTDDAGWKVADYYAIRRAEARAAELAGRLFDRYIIELTDEQYAAHTLRRSESQQFDPFKTFDVNA